MFALKNHIQALLDQRVRDRRAMGLCVALISPDGAVDYFSAGDCGQRAGGQINADTVFEIGSITKTFTGTLLAQMVERGEASLQATVRQYAPAALKFRGNGAGDISVLQLVTHTSGLPRLPLSLAFVASMLRDTRNPYKHYSLEQMWAYVADKRLNASIAHGFNYSNLGFGLLGELLATKAGLTYSQLVQRDITGPLGMADTGATTPESAAGRLALGHNGKLKVTSYWDVAAMPGAGALRSTARDMARYVLAQQHGTLAGARFSQTPRASAGEGMEVGLAWITLTAYDDVIVWHNGETGGFCSFAGFSRKSGLGVAVLCNAAMAVDDLALHLLNPKFKLAA